MGRKLVDVECALCGAALQRRKDQVRAKSFCGLECRNAYNRGGVLINEELKQEVRKMYDDKVNTESIKECFCISSTMLYEIVEKDRHGKYI